MTTTTTAPLEFAYDEDTLEQAAARVQDEYGLIVTEIATPGAVLASHGAWPLVTFTGHVGSIIRFMRDCYSTGDAEMDLETLRAAFGVDPA